MIINKQNIQLSPHRDEILMENWVRVELIDKKGSTIRKL